MTMSKKDFNLMAIEFGQQLAQINESKYPEQIRNIVMATALDSIKAFCYVAYSANNNFDSSRFYDFVDEVRDGRRDSSGKLVTKGKLEDFLTHSELSEALIAQRKAKA